MPCYSGPNPIKDDERMAIWRWAKENGIDHGLPFEKVHDAINQHFFAGQARPEWITDVLSGRKTPLRQVSNVAWKAQYNRRQVIQQAKTITREQSQNPVFKTIGKLWNIPRAASVFGHGVVFPITHGGDLALRPQSWGVFMRGVLNTWSKSWSPAKTEQLLYSMRRQPLFDTALRSGLDVGEKAARTDLVNPTKKGSQSERAFSMLTAMRFELWNHEMEKYVRPGMTQEQVLDVGRNLAEWANHATGSAAGPLSKIPGVGNFVFGPKLTDSKFARLFSDPVKTVNTFANWNQATAGEKAAAWTRLSGATQYLGTALGLLAVNQGVLMATGQKQQINFNDPTKGDWLAFKAGGTEFSFPGLHSEFKVLGKILATSFMDNKLANKFSHGAGKQAMIAEILGNYALGKANPVIGMGRELLTGQDFMGRPLPWAGKGTPKKPPYTWTEYALSHGPIPLQGPIKYVYDQMRSKGASAMDAMAILKGLIITGVGGTGMHIQAEKEDARRAQVGRSLMNR